MKRDNLKTRNKWNDGSLQCGFGASTPEKEAIICGRKV
jgi:hypothetical protein